MASAFKETTFTHLELSPLCASSCYSHPVQFLLPPHSQDNRQETFTSKEREREKLPRKLVMENTCCRRSKHSITCCNHRRFLFSFPRSLLHPHCILHLLYHFVIFFLPLTHIQWATLLVMFCLYNLSTK